MLGLGGDAERFYANLAARAAAEEYRPIEQAAQGRSGTNASAGELDVALSDLSKIARKGCRPAIARHPG
jgi:hypothetical protein